jgi:Ca2+-binding EF-hand superfamily protein
MDCFGNNKRKNTVIPEPDYKALMKMTHYSKAELKELFGQFETLADAENGTIDKIAFLAIPELACCCVSSMIFDRESVRNLKNSLEFMDFVVILDLLSRNTAMEEKAKCKLRLRPSP